MNIYDMLKNGASEEEISAALETALQNTANKYNAELAAAKARIAEEEEAAAKAQKAQTMCLREEARAHLINALLAYNEVFGVIPQDEITDEFIQGVEAQLIELEDDIALSLAIVSSLEGQEIDMKNIWKQFF